MQKCASDEQLKVVLDDISILAFPLLSWIIKSNRAHLSLVAPEKQLKVQQGLLIFKLTFCWKEMHTPHQFQLVNSFPEHERKFYEWKEMARKEGKGKGSYFAFHGYPFINANCYLLFPAHQFRIGTVSFELVFEEVLCLESTWHKLQMLALGKTLNVFQIIDFLLYFFFQIHANRWRQSFGMEKLNVDNQQ